MRNYTIHFLDDREFEALPYKDVETSLGLADTHTKEVYVRQTGVAPIDMFTAMHEIEHLEEGRGGVHAHHETYGDGVFYKGFGQVLQMAAPVLGMIPGVGPLLSVGAGIGGGVMNSREQAKQQQAAMQQQQMAMQHPQQPQISSPKVSSPNVVQPSFGSQAQDPSRSQSLFDVFNANKTKGALAGR